MFEWPIEGPQWTPSRCALTARPALIRPSIVDSIRGFQCPIFPKSRAWPIPGLSPVSARSDPTNFEPCKCLFLVFLVAVLLWSPVDRLSAFPFNLGSIDVVACPLTFVILSAFFFPPSVGVQRSSAVHFILWIFLSTFPSFPPSSLPIFPPLLLQCPTLPSFPRYSHPPLPPPTGRFEMVLHC